MAGGDANLANASFPEPVQRLKNQKVKGVLSDAELFGSETGTIVHSEKTAIFCERMRAA